MATRAAIAVFVKTIGKSPVKTRLAEGIGQSKAEEFYRRSCRAIASVIEPLDATSYWAVADEGESEWEGFDRVYQGEGSLGERIDRVYRMLLEKHSSVTLIGADSPQLDPMTFESALSIPGFVVGPAEDGGFYLFKGEQEIGREVWTSIPYSDERTLEELERRLPSLERLPAAIDVDTSEDLERLKDILKTAPNLTLPQQELRDWLLD